MLRFYAASAVRRSQETSTPHRTTPSTTLATTPDLSPFFASEESAPAVARYTTSSHRYCSRSPSSPSSSSPSPRRLQPSSLLPDFRLRYLSIGDSSSPSPTSFGTSTCHVSYYATALAETIAVRSSSRTSSLCLFRYPQVPQPLPFRFGQSRHSMNENNLLFFFLKPTPPAQVPNKFSEIQHVPTRLVAGFPHLRSLMYKRFPPLSPFAVAALLLFYAIQHRTGHALTTTPIVPTRFFLVLHVYGPPTPLRYAVNCCYVLCTSLIRESSQWNEPHSSARSIRNATTPPVIRVPFARIGVYGSPTPGTLFDRPLRASRQLLFNASPLLAVTFCRRFSSRFSFCPCSSEWGPMGTPCELCSHETCALIQPRPCIDHLLPRALHQEVLRDSSRGSSRKLRSSDHASGSTTSRLRPRTTSRFVWLFPSPPPGFFGSLPLCSFAHVIQYQKQCSICGSARVTPTKPIECCHLCASVFR